MLQIAKGVPIQDHGIIGVFQPFRYDLAGKWTKNVTRTKNGQRLIRYSCGPVLEGSWSEGSRWIGSYEDVVCCQGQTEPPRVTIKNKPEQSGKLR